MGVKYNHLSLLERTSLYYLRHYSRPRLSIREIARRLNRSHSTISRELKRNSDCWCNQYYHKPAQKMARIRLRNRAQRLPLKNEKTRDYVVSKLMIGWSPEIISGRLKLQAKLKYICHESIYQYIYKYAQELIKYLPRMHKKRRKKYPYRKYIPKAKFKVSILDRPQEVNDRSVFGHWESDSIESRHRNSAVNVLVERKSRLTHITRLVSKKAFVTKNAIVKKLSSHPGDFIKSITYDNGCENAAHLETNDELKCNSYFCQPYHSWEKGSVEQINGLIRRYYPKRTDFLKVSDKKLFEVEQLLNSRPRKCLNFKTPYESYEDFCKIDTM